MNQMLKIAKNAWFMMYECKKFSVQGIIVLTFLGVRMDDFDLYMFLEASGTQWHKYLGLNRPRRWFLDLSFSWKIPSLFWDFWRSFQVMGTRVSMCICMWVIRSKNLSQRIKELMKQYLIFHAIIFKSFSCYFGLNHIQSP